MPRPRLLFIGADRAVREDLVFADADVTRADTVESARRLLLREPDLRTGPVLIAYGLEVARRYGLPGRHPAPLGLAWGAPIVLVHGPVRLPQIVRELLGTETVVSLPRDWDWLTRRLATLASATP